MYAEREGFEPSIELPLYFLSREAPSATRPPLRVPSRVFAIRATTVNLYHFAKNIKVCVWARFRFPIFQNVV